MAPSIISDRKPPHGKPPQYHNGGTDTQEDATGVCNTYATILSRFWYLICIIIFAMLAAYSTMAFTLYDIPDFLDPVKGFEARGTVISARLKSLSNLLFHSDDYLTPQVIVPSSDGNVASLSNALTCNRADDPLPVTNNSISGIHFGASLWDWNEQFPKIVFEGVDGVDILSREGIRSVCSAERNFVTSHPGYNSNCLCHQEGHCLSTWSIGNYVALLSNKRSCDEIDDNDVILVVALLGQCAPFFHGRTRSELLESGDVSSVPAECAQHDYAVHTILFFLLPLEFSETIVANGTVEKAEVTVVFFPISVSEGAALETIYWDNLHRCACSDGTTQLKAIEFSLKNPLFATLLFADSLYLGIGSAVIFVLIWLYTGTFIVTVAAILNMVFSFLMAYFFYTVVFARPFFPFSNVLTAVLIIGIGADDAFVFIDLWKKCRLEMEGQDLVAITRETLRHATATMFVTSFTTASALYASIISGITAVKCFGVFAGTAILMNFILTLTLMPAFVVLQHKVSPLICSTEGSRDDPKPGQNSCRQSLVKFVRKFFEEALPSFVFKLRYLWTIVFLLLGAGGAVVIFYKPGLQLPSVGENQLLIISHPFEQYDFVFKEKFAFSQKNRPYVPGYIVWGVDALDNGDWWDPDDEGTFVPQDNFILSSPSDQQWLLGFCHDLRNQSFFNSNGPYSCFMENVKILMELPCATDPVTGQGGTPCCGHSTFPYSSSVFGTCLDRFHNTGLVPNVRFKKNNSTVGVITLPFTMSYKQSLLYTLNEELWTQANTWVETQLESAPEILQAGWFVPFTFDIGFYDLQRSLASGTTVSMLVTLGIGSVILLFSIQNIILTVNAMVTITSAVFVTVGTLVLLGWELNIVESTVITLSVGLSVDFTIHYGVAYRMAPHNDRKGRTLYFLSTMSGAISVAALSSFVAGALVMPATVYGYTQFGIFFMIVMSTSWTYSTFLFGSLCYIVGPQKSTGDVPCSSCCNCFGYGGRSHTSAPSVDHEMQVREYYSPGERPHSSESISTITSNRFLPIQSHDSTIKHLEGHITTANWKGSSQENYFPNNNWPSVMSKPKAERYLEQSYNNSSVIYSPKRSRYPANGTDIHYNYKEVHFNPVYNINMR